MCVCVYVFVNIALENKYDDGLSSNMFSINYCMCVDIYNTFTFVTYNDSLVHHLLWGWEGYDYNVGWTLYGWMASFNISVFSVFCI